MVQKKTNCQAVNSGNSMRKRFFRQKIQKHIIQTTHVIKSLHNIPVIKYKNGAYWEADMAKVFVDDGDLADNKQIHGYFKEIYSLNKKKRWLLERIVADAVNSEKLAKETFKVTLVHRTVSYSQLFTKCSTHSNVTHYYDSQCSLPEVVSSRKAGTTRQSLIQKANKRESEDHHRKARLQCRKCHQHFQGIQQKKAKSMKKDSRVTQEANAVRSDIPEIRYEIGQVERLTSLDLTYIDIDRYPYNYKNKQPGTRFRGFHREKVEWYFTEALLISSLERRYHKYTAESSLDGGSVFEEADINTELIWSPPPPRQYSLWDLAIATEHKNHHKLNRKSHRVTVACAESTGNSASSQSVKRNGKGAAIFVDQEREKVWLSTTDEDMDNTFSEPATNDDRRLQSNEKTEVSSLENIPSSIVNYEEEFSQFDKSFSSCMVPDSDMKISCLQGVFGGAVEFGRCVPFTVKFDLQTVWQMRRKDPQDEGFVGESAGPQDWWLLCQAGKSNLAHREGATLVKMRLYGNHKEGNIAAANRELQQLVTCRESVVMLIYGLLDMICDLVGQHSVHRWSDVSEGSCKTTVSSGRCKLEVEVCSVNKAYHHLETVKQCTDKEDLAISHSLSWCNMECSICFKSFEDWDTFGDGFNYCVAMTTCGRSFCRRCWQYHLTSSIIEGRTTFHCMEWISLSI